MFRSQEEKGVLAKGASETPASRAQEDKPMLRDVAPAVHVALREPQPEEAHILRKPPSKKPPSLGSWAVDS